MGILTSEPIEEEEISMLVVGFAARMRSRKVRLPLVLEGSGLGSLLQMMGLRRTGQ